MGFASRAELSPRSRHEISSALVARSALDRVERTLASPDSAVEASSTSSRGGSSSSISSILGPMVWRVCWNSAGDRGGGGKVLWSSKSDVSADFFLAFGFFRRFGNSRARLSTLDARRSTLDARPRASSPPRLIACSRRVSVHYQISNDTRFTPTSRRAVPTSPPPRRAPRRSRRRAARTSAWASAAARRRRRRPRRSAVPRRT